MKCTEIQPNALENVEENYQTAPDKRIGCGIGRLIINNYCILFEHLGIDRYLILESVEEMAACDMAVSFKKIF